MQILNSRLDEQGIQCTLKNFYPPAAGEVTPAVAWPELWVMNDAQFSKANKIIQEEIEKHKENQEPWQCSHCGEQLEGQFNSCWKCGENRDM